MAQVLEESTGQLDSTTIGIYRTAATVKGGRRFSFGALVVVGDKNGRVGYGYGKANEVPTAIEKAEKDARKTLMRIERIGTTINHEVEGRFGSSRVRLIPASPGTGAVAGATVRAVLQMAGIRDCLTKCYGSTNARNVVKATFDGLARLRSPAAIAELRGVELGQTEIAEKIERGKAFMPSTQETPDGERARGPVNTVGQDRRPGGRQGGRQRGRRGPRPDDRAQQSDSAPPQTQTDSPPADQGQPQTGSDNK